MSTNKIRFEDTSKDWKIWSKANKVERSIRRLKKHLPEMECSKKLSKIIKKIYKPGYKVLDFGCASGHYYNTLKKIDKNINYTGFDSTENYINFAKKFFKKNQNVNFDVQNLFSMSQKYKNLFDITFCSNVLLHLPSIDLPLKNIITSTKKYCIVRTLVSDYTHLSRHYYNDRMDASGFLNNFVFQNTYSYNLVREKIKKIGNFEVKFEDDEFNGKKINDEYKKDKKKYSGLTRYLGGHQITGSKIFEYKWIIIKKLSR
jgi:2-polyprenyl-3-methyl-5-hydroxy-6-metoxy-1,4-benzoquinol methylase